MPATYTALVTPGEVRRGAFLTLGETVGAQIQAASGDLYEAVVDIIEDATRLVESHLGRGLIVRPQTLRYKAEAWCAMQGYENTDEDLLIVAWARQWPAVEITAVDGDALKAPDLMVLSASGTSDIERLAYDPESTLITEPPYRVDGFFGYRRSDQGVGTPGSGDSWTSDLLLEPGLAALSVNTEDVPLLPGDIRRAALMITIFDIRQQMQGLIGLDASTKTVDRMTVDLQKTRHEFVDEQLAAIHHHRRVPA